MTRKTKPQLLTDFMAGLNEATSAAGVILHQHQDMRWAFIRKILEEVIDRCVKMVINPLTAARPTAVKKRPTQVLMP